MEQIEIMAKLREKVGKSAARKSRKGDVVPAVCYGGDSSPVHIEVSTMEVKKAIATPYGLNTIINLKIASNKETISKKVLIKDVQKDVFGKKVLHMDFVEIRDEKPIRVKVPVRLTGKAKGVAEGGILQQIIRELDIKCLPGDIPIAIEHDVTSLGIGGAIHVRDLKVPERSKVLVDKDRTVAVIVEVKEEVVAGQVPAAGAAASAEGSAPSEGSAAPATAQSPAAGAAAEKPAAAKPSQVEKK
ncbi:MAG: 50S ribosomal protein L25 [Myxococcota bacterium]